jgi:PIN domain nuclease of toxin-antitoxin system
MRILIDTNILLWSQLDPDRLDVAVVRAIEDPANDILFSAASIWEIAIKAALGRADFASAPGDPITPRAIWDAARASDFALLPIDAEAALAAGALPPHHRDPFDRMIVAQAMITPATLFTSDRRLAAYSPLVQVVG